MKHPIKAVLKFFYVESCSTSAYNNRFLFDIPENDYYRILDYLEASNFIEAVGIRHNVQGYNTYRITTSGIRLIESETFENADPADFSMEG